MPFLLALKSEALYLAGRTPEALEAINEGETVAERFEQRYSLSRLHRLRRVFLAAIGVPRRPKLRLRFAQPLILQNSRSRFR